MGINQKRSIRAFDGRGLAFGGALEGEGTAEADDRNEKFEDASSINLRCGLAGSFLPSSPPWPCPPQQDAIVLISIAVCLLHSVRFLTCERRLPPLL